MASILTLELEDITDGGKLHAGHSVLVRYTIHAFPIHADSHGRHHRFSVCARQNPVPVAERLAAQKVLFDEQYESDLHEFPERATDLGDYRYNDKLADHSLAAALRREKINESFLARLRAISSEGFSDQDQLSHDLLVRGLEQRIVDFELKEYEMPINQFNGVHTTLADLPNAVPFDSVKHYEDYIARLHQIPRVLSQTTEVLRAGMKDKLMPVRFLLEKIPAQCQGIIGANPFLTPTKKLSSKHLSRRSEEIDATDYGCDQL